MGSVASSRSSLDRYEIGLEFTIASTSVNAVDNSSNDILALPMLFLKHRFTDCTIRLKKPSHHGAFSRLKDHFTFNCARYRAAEENVFALSEITCTGVPLLAVNCLNDLRKVCVFMSVTISRCIPHVTQQVNKHIHTFLLSDSSDAVM